MSADQTVCLLSEKRSKGYATRIMTMDGEVRLAAKSSRNLITDMTVRNFWPTQWEIIAYYGLYEGSRNIRLNKAEIGPGVAYYPVTDSQRNTSWINASVITGVTGTASGAVIETSVGVNFQLTKTARNVRSDLAAVRVISHWMSQVNSANQRGCRSTLLEWLGWPERVPVDVDVLELEKHKIHYMLGHLALHISLEPVQAKSLASVADYLQTGNREKFHRVKMDWIDDVLTYY
ncbi:hypothetical protein [Weissella confusa]|uniref:Uncharacterized protein n=1 Tax=Weissella confusa TaxID=1583 RepID=A0AAJ2YZC1_WEICO|nr:hypothetical protein [Weissella confusa]NBA11676.1 hypothetical protein [Weissella confusa]